MCWKAFGYLRLFASAFFLEFSPGRPHSEKANEARGGKKQKMKNVLAVARAALPRVFREGSRKEQPKARRIAD